MNLNFQNALVTGGAGFIGSHLVETLLEKGCRVTVLDNLSTGNLSNLAGVKGQFTFYRGDIRDRKLLLDISKGCELVFHLAAVVSVPQTVEHPIESAMVNEMGTLFVLEAARKNKARCVVFSSSCAVYGEGTQGPKHETMRPEPKSPYAVQKLAGENYVRLDHELYGLETVCLRYFNVFGPRQNPSSHYSGVISIFLNKVLSREVPVIYGDGNQYRDFVYVKDVVNANLLAAGSEGSSGKVFNIGTGKFIRINQLWEVINGIAGLNIEPAYQPQRSGDILESVARIDHARTLLGFDPSYSLEKGIKVTYEWYRNAF